MGGTWHHGAGVRRSLSPRVGSQRRADGPRNRLVALSLEDDWNKRLRDVVDAEAELERKQRERPAAMGEECDRVLTLSRDFPRLWRDPGTKPREKKRLLRLIIEEVTLDRSQTIRAHVRFRGGATATVEVPRPETMNERDRAEPELVALIDELLDEHTEKQIAEIFTQRGLRSPRGANFNKHTIRKIRVSNGLELRADRLKRRGFLSKTDACKRLRIGIPKLDALVAEDLVARHVAAGRSAFYEIRPALGRRPHVPVENELQYDQ